MSSILETRKKRVLIALVLLLIILGITYYFIGVQKNNVTGSVVAEESVKVLEEATLEEAYKGTNETVKLWISAAQEDIQQMRQVNMETADVTALFIEMLEEANDESPNYEKIQENGVLIAARKREAFKDLLQIKEAEITNFEETTNADASSLWNLYTKAQIEIVNKDYAIAVQTLNAITPTLEVVKKEESKLPVKFMERIEKTSNAITNNATTLFIIFLIVSFFIILLNKNKLEKFILKRRIDHLSIEQEVLENLIKKVDNEYTEQKITKTMYSMEMEMYKDRMEEIEEKLKITRIELEQRKHPWVRINRNSWNMYGGKRIKRNNDDMRRNNQQSDIKERKKEIIVEKKILVPVSISKKAKKTRTKKIKKVKKRPDFKQSIVSSIGSSGSSVVSENSEENEAALNTVVSETMQKRELQDTSQKNTATSKDKIIPTVAEMFDFLIGKENDKKR